MTSKSHALFNKVFGGHPNVITPDIIARKQIGEVHYELSSGDGFGTDTVYGVTVLSATGERMSSLGGCFESRDKALDHIATLKEYKA